jgi:hypothetical protein
MSCPKSIDCKRFKKPNFEEVMTLENYNGVYFHCSFSDRGVICDAYIPKYKKTISNDTNLKGVIDV